MERRNPSGERTLKMTLEEKEQLYYSNFTDILIETRLDNEWSVPEPKCAYTTNPKMRKEFMG